MTREEYEIRTWQTYYAEAERFNMFTPTAYADNKTAQHMAHAAIQNRVPWDVDIPVTEGS